MSRTVLLLGTWHRRCGGPYYWRRAFRHAGWDVVGRGPWRADEPFGSHGREPEICQDPIDGAHNLAGTVAPDLVFLCDGGEGYRVAHLPPDVPFVHFSTEGSNMGWSIGLTPHRYAALMCNGADADVQWLPNAYDTCEHWHSDGALREYDLVQIASARPARKCLWAQLAVAASDLHIRTGDLWGPLYGAAYRHARATWVCTTLDFVSMRVVEAMAMGCVVIADRQPSMSTLFTEGEHFIGYDGVPGPHGENTPDPQWLVDTARQLRRDGDGGMAERAWRAVQPHSYLHRVERVLAEVFG